MGRTASHDGSIRDETVLGHAYELEIMSSADIGPRVIHSDEFEETMDLVNRCFEFESEELEARMPHCFDEAHPERHAIIERNGEIVSHVVYVPAEVWVNGARLSSRVTPGIGTSPSSRCVDRLGSSTTPGVEPTRSAGTK